MRRQVPSTLSVVSIVGARPNFMKVAPVVAELSRRTNDFSSILVHTGQHYDAAMSDVFFEELGIGPPDRFLGVGSGTHAQQTARVMERLEPVLLDIEPDILLVSGDVNSTLGASLVASKLGIHIGHIEAGLRSFDRSMPEEINRVVTDALSDLLFVHSPEAIDNLMREGSRASAIHFVGNTMIDTLVSLLPRVTATNSPSRLGLEPRQYIVVTLHRPALVDGPLLQMVITELQVIAKQYTVVFPMHPRTRARMTGDLAERALGNRVRVLEPVGYLDFMSLLQNSAAVLTDSGGIQEETTYLGIPCFTLRSTTERPITCSVGTNTLLGLDPGRIAEVPRLIDTLQKRPHRIPDKWDGHAASRIVDVLAAGSPSDRPGITSSPASPLISGLEPRGDG